MATKRVVVINGSERRFVQIDYKSLPNTKDAVRRKWNMSSEFILQGTVNDNLVDIMDQDDLAAFKDAGELFVQLKTSDKHDGHFVTFINGKYYSSKKLSGEEEFLHFVQIDGDQCSIKELPSAGSSVVSKEFDALMTAFNRPVCINRVVKCIRLVHNAVACIGYEIASEADKILSMTVMAILQSNKALDFIGMDLSNLLDGLAFGFNFILLKDEDMARKCFYKARDISQSMREHSKELCHLIEKSADEVRDFDNTVARYEHKEASSIESTSARNAVRFLNSDFTAFNQFWSTLDYTIEYVIDSGHMQDMLDEDRFKILVTKPTVKKHIVGYYAKLIALKEICKRSAQRLQSMEDHLLVALAEIPRNVEEARANLPRMLDDLLDNRHATSFVNTDDDDDDDDDVDDE